MRNICFTYKGKSSRTFECSFFPTVWFVFISPVDCQTFLISSKHDQERDKEERNGTLWLPQIESVVITWTEIAPLQVPGEPLKVLPPVTSHPDRGLRCVKDHLIEKLLDTILTYYRQSSLENSASLCSLASFIFPSTFWSRCI